MDRNEPDRRVGAAVVLTLVGIALFASCGEDKGTGIDGETTGHYLAGIWSVTESGHSCEMSDVLEPYWTYEKQWIDTIYPGELIYDPSTFCSTDLALPTPIVRMELPVNIGVNTPDRVDMLSLGTCETPACRGPVSIRYRGTPDSLAWLLQKNIRITYGGAHCGLTDSARICFSANTVYTRIGDAPLRR